MRSKCWMYIAVALLFSLGANAFADHDHDRDGDEGHRREHHYREAHYSYNDHDRDEMRAYYHNHHRDLPPGLGKRDYLPPGMERRLRVHYVLDDDMRGYMRPCPPELEERLPPPPPQCAHTIIGGHVVLINSNTHIVLDIFHFDR
ncbi:MAG: hypothetical protein JO266_13315 [Acidobacteria bacterium]|nr:hypothetical protein [Acidobacteriota bacterium]MBV8892923.1 hypothetical protein [Acidobacteriota bacterium]